jgi:crotonobetaine/carnitine-CoA ligase
MYTSGTTGPAKGVIIPWGSWTAAFEFMAHVFSPDDVLYAPFPFYHGLARVSLTAAAMAGASVVVRESFKTQFFWDDIDGHGCTFSATTPTVLQWLLNEPASDRDARHALRRILSYGPQLPRFAERFGVEMSSMFAMTEVGSVIVYNERDLPAGASGRQRPGYDLRIVDEFDQEVPVGEVGELIARADRPWTTNLGYYGLPKESLNAWRNGWYHSGDNFRVDADGFYYFTDRKKDMIRRRGVNISSFQIESVALEFPEAHEVAAIGVPSPDGEDDIKIFVVEKPGHTIDPREMHRFLLDALPKFMVPRYIEIVGELPKTPVTFRVRKHLLRDQPANTNSWDAMAEKEQA